MGEIKSLTTAVVAFVALILALMLTNRSLKTPWGEFGVVAPSSSVSPSVANADTSPEQTVQEYYQLLNQRQYVAAWAKLSSQYKQTAASRYGTDLNRYSDLWNRVQAIEVRQVNSVAQANDAVTVSVQLQITASESADSQSKSVQLQLVRDPANRAWLIDQESE